MMYITRVGNKPVARNAITAKVLSSVTGMSNFSEME